MEAREEKVSRESPADHCPVQELAASESGQALSASESLRCLSAEERSVFPPLPPWW
jgi:hypothetical protein